MEPRKFIVGQKLQSFPGRTLNSLIEAQRRAKSPAAKLDNRSPAEHRSSSVVQLYWDQEDTLPPGSVVKLGDPMFLPADDESAPFEGLRFKAITPTADDEDGVLAITSDAIPEGEVGYGWMPNACWAQVDVQDDAHEFAATQAGVTLKSAATGRVPIFWKPTGLTTPEKAWCVVMLQAPGGGGTTIYSGNLIATVPPYSSVDDCVRIMTFQPLTNTYGVVRVVGAHNRGPQTIRGSEDFPTPVWGPMLDALAEVAPETFEARERLEIMWPPYSGTPGHVTTTSDGHPQAPYHESGTDDYTMDGGPCTSG